jgi:hypothetical protein
MSCTFRWPKSTVSCVDPHARVAPAAIRPSLVHSTICIGSVSVIEFISGYVPSFPIRTAIDVLGYPLAHRAAAVTGSTSITGRLGQMRQTRWRRCALIKENDELRPREVKRGAVLALNGSAAAELYCGKSRRAGKSRPMRRESAGYRITSLCPSGTVRKRDGTPRGGQQRDTAPSPPVIVLGRTLSGARLRERCCVSPDPTGVLGR